MPQITHPNSPYYTGPQPVQTPSAPRPPASQTVIPQSKKVAPETEVQEDCSFFGFFCSTAPRAPGFLEQAGAGAKNALTYAGIIIAATIAWKIWK